MFITVRSFEIFFYLLSVLMWDKMVSYWEFCNMEDIPSFCKRIQIWLFIQHHAPAVECLCFHGLLRRTSARSVMLTVIHTKDKRAAISRLGFKFFHPPVVRHSCLCDRLRQELIISRPVAMLQMAISGWRSRHAQFLVIARFFSNFNLKREGKGKGMEKERKGKGRKCKSSPT